MTIVIHWTLLAALIGFAAVGVITLALQIIFAVWCGQGRYDKFERRKY